MLNMGLQLGTQDFNKVLVMLLRQLRVQDATRPAGLNLSIAIDVFCRVFPSRGWGILFQSRFQLKSERKSFASSEIERIAPVLAYLTALILLTPSLATNNLNPADQHNTPAKGKAMSQFISGRFDVNLQSETLAHPELTEVFGRRSLRKQFHGELAASSLGEMLSYRGQQAGSAAYVAIEQVQGKLQGKSGSFALAHYGRMQAGQSELILQVVPDSGTHELSGLKGEMKIIIKDKQHFYEFNYQLPTAQN